MPGYFPRGDAAKPAVRRLAYGAATRGRRPPPRVQRSSSRQQPGEGQQEQLVDEVDRQGVAAQEAQRGRGRAAVAQREPSPAVRVERQPGGEPEEGEPGPRRQWIPVDRRARRPPAGDRPQGARARAVEQRAPADHEQGEAEERVGERTEGGGQRHQDGARGQQVEDAEVDELVGQEEPRGQGDDGRGAADEQEAVTGAAPLGASRGADPVAVERDGEAEQGDEGPRDQARGVARCITEPSVVDVGPVPGEVEGDHRQDRQAAQRVDLPEARGPPGARGDGR